MLYGHLDLFFRLERKTSLLSGKPDLRGEYRQRRLYIMYTRLERIRALDYRSSTLRVCLNNTLPRSVNIYVAERSNLAREYLPTGCHRSKVF